MAESKGNEVLRELGGAIGRYLSELYRRVEELERQLAPAAAQKGAEEELGSEGEE
jgi:hypothetical protein